MSLIKYTAEMKRLIDLSGDDAKVHLLKGSSYFNGDLPSYISFEPILECVTANMGEKSYLEFKSKPPGNFSNVNYSLISNKDGRFAWRPYELMHPVIYVSLVNLICKPDNWAAIVDRFSSFGLGVVDCCSAPVISTDVQSDVATQIKSWWQMNEQRSLCYSLEYSHILHTDVTDCYGSLYTHSIAWALHGMETAKKKKTTKALLGNKIDAHIQASRYGQTNGICQGSVLMDFIAELVLGYVDTLIDDELCGQSGFRILRYRDDYRIFTNSDEDAERILKIISDQLRSVGMKLGLAKTTSSKNIVEGSIKPDKMAGIALQDLGKTNAKTIQKQLLRLHAFGQKHQNSGALRRLVAELHTGVSKQKATPDDLEVQVAIATDIGFVSPATFPAVAGILSHLISLAVADEKIRLWSLVREKMGRIPYNGYLELWLQRVTQTKSVGISFASDEPLCQIVNGAIPELWNSGWISSGALISCLDVSKIVVADPEEVAEVIMPEEIDLFVQQAWAY